MPSHVAASPWWPGFSYEACISQDDLARRYGYFLWALTQAGQLDPGARAGAQVTPEAVEPFIALVEPYWSSVTLFQSVFKLRRMTEILAPDRDLSWLRAIEADLRAEARPRRRREDVTANELLQAGEALFREAEKASHLSPKKRACLARNGLMMALLAVRPIRHKNFGELMLGTSFRHLDGCWWIVLEAEDTKGGRVDERCVPDYLNPLIARYLTTYRPILLGEQAAGLNSERVSARGTQPLPDGLLENLSGPLWIAATGQPLTYSAVGAAITDTTEATAGVRLSPHAFRRAARTTVTYFGGEHPHLTQGVLQHNSARVGDEHYDSSSTRRAGLELTAIIRELTK
ncbi:site-specific integrase [Microvirga sp. KLBC 81]|uniref:site-specific integrase n=1 Tax=Microvirga sp. KLBC 81 TaxID=1862707 RepID=UPI000D513A48|nr:site-specific integrase [Microvirga sp. KLBC 81]PVE21707.1 site-specific integrase [Microvirga sp. KLBC 81]